MNEFASIWVAIINPVSGFGKPLKSILSIRNALKKEGISFVEMQTEPNLKADQIVIQKIEEGYRNFICIGGDGHLNDLVNGIFTQQIVPTTAIQVAMISLGTGNDWVRTSGLPTNIAEAVAVIKSGKNLLQNVGLATFIKNGQKQSRYFINFAGVGFDSYVLQKSIALKKYGRIAYLLGMIKCLFTYEKCNLKVIADQKAISTLSYLTIAGIGQYGGGGMRLMPGADLAGENFYITIAKDLSKWEVFKNILKLYDGSFINLPKVAVLEAKNLKIEVLANKENVFMEVDGEVLGTGPFELKLIQKSLKIRIPK